MYIHVPLLCTNCNRRFCLGFSVVVVVSYHQEIQFVHVVCIDTNNAKNTHSFFFFLTQRNTPMPACGSKRMCYSNQCIRNLLQELEANKTKLKKKEKKRARTQHIHIYIQTCEDLGQQNKTIYTRSSKEMYTIHHCHCT